MTQSFCVFGDSIASGIVFDNVRNKYVLMKDWLKSKSCSVAENFARFGCTVGRGGDIIKKHLGDVNKYDFTILEFGGNDCDYDWKAVAENPNGTHSPKTTMTEFVHNYTNIIKEIRQHLGNPVLVNLPPIDSEKYFNWVSQGLDKDNILRWLGDKERIYRWHEFYNTAVHNLSSVHNVPLIDIRSKFLDKNSFTEYICDDGIHPNPAGYEMIEKSILGYVGSKKQA